VDRKRPAILTVGGIIMLLVGIAELGLGLIWFTQRNDADLIVETGLESSRIGSYGVVYTILGALTILLAIGLLRGSRLARFLIALVNIGNIVGGVIHIVDGNEQSRSAGIGGIVGALIVLYILYGNDRVRAYFA
jgi:hypothetical protein